MNNLIHNLSCFYTISCILFMFSPPKWELCEGFFRGLLYSPMGKDIKVQPVVKEEAMMKLSSVDFVFYYH